MGSFKGNKRDIRKAIFKDFSSFRFLFFVCFSISLPIVLPLFSYQIGNPGILANKAPWVPVFLVMFASDCDFSEKLPYFIFDFP